MLHKVFVESMNLSNEIHFSDSPVVPGFLLSKFSSIVGPRIKNEIFMDGISWHFSLPKKKFYSFILAIWG